MSTVMVSVLRRGAFALIMVVGLATLLVHAAIAAPDYRLGSGDELRITVFGEDDLSGSFRVDGSGAVAMPLIGDVSAGGLTVRQLELALVMRLKDGYLKHPRVSVEVLNFRPFYILGEVKSPGSYPYVSGMTVLNAVALAGGYTYRARKSRVMITRAGEAAAEPVAAEPATIVQPGDIIRIPERFF